MRVLIDAKVPAFSFIYGIPSKDILDECRAKDIVIFGTASTADEAIELQRANADVIAATEPDAYRRDVPKAQVHVLDAGHTGYPRSYETDA